MKMSVGTMAALVLVAVAVSALVINFGMVQAAKGDVKASIKADLKLKDEGTNVDVKVKANGLKPNVTFVVRAYGSDNCSGSLLAVIGSDDSGNKGKIKISKTIPFNIDDVNSVSVRDPGAPGKIVVCFQDTT